MASPAPDMTQQQVDQWIQEKSARDLATKLKKDYNDKVLEVRFNQSQNISRMESSLLGESLQMEGLSIEYWFQKRRRSKELENEVQSSPEILKLLEEVAEKTKQFRRIRVMEDQETILEKRYRKSHIISLEERTELGQALGLPEQIVANWFLRRWQMNRRAAKRGAQSGQGMEPSPGAPLEPSDIPMCWGIKYSESGVPYLSRESSSQTHPGQWFPAIEPIPKTPEVPIGSGSNFGYEFSPAPLAPFSALPVAPNCATTFYGYDTLGFYKNYLTNSNYQVSDYGNTPVHNTHSGYQANPTPTTPWTSHPAMPFQPSIPQPPFDSPASPECPASPQGPHTQQLSTTAFMIL